MSTDAAFRASRAVQSLLPDAEIIPAGEVADESYSGSYTEAPRLQQAECMEGSSLRAIRVVGDPEVRFAAFLDGIQRVRILCHWRGVPILLGVVAAVVRVRVNRRFVTWGHRTPIVARRLYMPLRYLACEARDEISGFQIVDTGVAGPSGHAPSRHPAALRAVALERVRADREDAERQLAELWCVDVGEPIFIDGGISGSATVARSECSVGVIKSHQTLYADGAALDVVMSLRRGERSSVFRVPSERRTEVVSWYLRLRDPRGHDAMFGLVRIEAALSDDVATRANEISRWVLGEALPLSLPDNRWDRMAYGIRDCEEFLRAIAS